MSDYTPEQVEAAQGRSQLLIDALERTGPQTIYVDFKKMNRFTGKAPEHLAYQILMQDHSVLAASLRDAQDCIKDLELGNKLKAEMIEKEYLPKIQNQEVELSKIRADLAQRNQTYLSSVRQRIRFANEITNLKEENTQLQKLVEGFDTLIGDALVPMDLHGGMKDTCRSISKRRNQLQDAALKLREGK